MSEVRVVTNITKEYPQMIKVVVFKEPRYYSVPEHNKRKREEVDDVEYNPSISSLNRTKSLVRDLVLCNNFELFCTFTFDPKKIDRKNYSRCSNAMRIWLYRQRDKAREKGREFNYLVIPEQHKDGAWHFHALISGYSSTLKDSGLKSATLRPIYNITAFRSGFTTAVPIDDKAGVSNYVTKYITKDFIKMFNKRRFFCSRNLVRPRKTINSPIFSKSLPLFRHKVADSLYTEEYLLDVF